jgi:hypothetical protein
LDRSRELNRLIREACCQISEGCVGRVRQTGIAHHGLNGWLRRVTHTKLLSHTHESSRITAASRARRSLGPKGLGKAGFAPG